MEKPSRIDVVDSLRAFALLGIVLIHSFEHFNLFYLPEYLPDFVKAIDKGMHQTLYFIFAGKAYGIFSLLFGFSFYIQLHNNEQRRYDFRTRFAWRLLILFVVFAQLNSLLYNGDILGLYALVGLILILSSKWSDKTVLIVAVLFMLQPVEWARTIYTIWHPEYASVPELNWKYYGLIMPVMEKGNLWDVIRANWWNGQIADNLWQLENGRFFISGALFLFGMLLGRRGLFLYSEENLKFWKKVTWTSLVVFIPLYVLSLMLVKSTIPALQMLNRIFIPALHKFAFMGFLLGGYIILWHKGIFKKTMNAIIPYGRMSLTNYVSMGMIGSFIFYGWGLGLYKYTGATMSIFIGFLIFLGQLYFSKQWLKKYRQGPLEYVWKKLTWVNSDRSDISNKKMDKDRSAK